MPATGPNTETGKAIAARNSLKSGLFTAQDFVRAEELAEYNQLKTAIHAQLAPEGPLEESCVAEILSANWRLRRCRELEFTNVTALSDASLDRARNQAQNQLRRSLAGIGKLQTQRAIHANSYIEGLPPASDIKEIHNALRVQDRERLAARRAEGLDTFTKIINHLPPESSFCEKTEPPIEAAPETAAAPVAAPPVSSFCEVPATPSSFCKKKEPVRNAPCPCNSGLKYKKCCGRTGPAWNQEVARAA